MTAPSAFEWLSDRIPERAHLSRTEARGMIRIILRDNGLSPEGVTRSQLKAVIQRALAPALTRVKVQAAEDVCRGLMADLESAVIADPVSQDAGDIFGRIGRR